MNDPEKYAANVQHWREVAVVLRRNFVQAQRVEQDGGKGDEDVWRESLQSSLLFL